MSGTSQILTVGLGSFGASQYVITLGLNSPVIPGDALLGTISAQWSLTGSFSSQSMLGGLFPVVVESLDGTVLSDDSLTGAITSVLSIGGRFPAVDASLGGTISSTLSLGGSMTSQSSLTGRFYATS